jgi:hypothetical protein
MQAEKKTKDFRQERLGVVTFGYSPKQPTKSCDKYREYIEWSE